MCDRLNYASIKLLLNFGCFLKIQLNQFLRDVIVLLTKLLPTNRFKKDFALISLVIKPTKLIPPVFFLKIELCTHTTNKYRGIIIKVVNIANHIQAWNYGYITSQRIKVICFNFILRTPITTTRS